MHSRIAVLPLIYLGFSFTQVSGTEYRRSQEIDGEYHMLPCYASNDALSRMQDLGSLLVEPIKFYQLKVTGKIESIRISRSDDGFRVVAIDSAGNAVLSEIVKAKVEQLDGSKVFTLHYQWRGGDEWGTSKGQTTTTLSREKDGNLLARVIVESTERAFIFSKSKLKSETWLKYRPITSSVLLLP